jgi:SAM-dependent methyltransferase
LLSRSGAQPGGRKDKWESFWKDDQPEAEATHRIAAELVLGMLEQERRPGQQFRVLDLGCGAGQTMQLLEASGYRVVGLDLAEGALDLARERLGSGAWLMQGDALYLGVASGSCDAVISLGYASVGSFSGVQKEMARVLRPGGVSLVDYRHLGLYLAPLILIRGPQWLEAWRRGQLSLPLLGLRQASMWHAAGLRLETVKHFNTFPPLGAVLPPSFCLGFERRLGPRLGFLLGRTALARFRKIE